MGRKTASRGASSLVLVLSLALAGASPAAAADLGSWELSFDRLVSGLWSEVTGWLTGGTGVEKAAPRTTTNDTFDRGFGLDPNGNSTIVQPEPPAVVGPQG